eukprot:CAMPEP_0201668868 /NCGR_PEP_ID=MMETSP0494-20130426/21365_1 /ASSEMBLY_ACC=CAM_ASM_000839 /TAXON_ID=420259 /ORGANISM="Thalassiosira gravida, Strain GMp14c1" /LENGTH=126 /DNA_ID=CAMNT_0048149435 /DNA_START=218 /DNA_END=595 /DNA_ORIENTATION=-
MIRTSALALHQFDQGILAIISNIHPGFVLLTGLATHIILQCQQHKIEALRLVKVIVNSVVGAQGRMSGALRQLERQPSLPVERAVLDLGTHHGTGIGEVEPEVVSIAEETKNVHEGISPFLEGDPW